ncbi:flagellar hook-length control protein FliK [Halarsenatibacter silvermanii]|uniref:Hook-length control protein FliK n=1 Tax=Halarsenatibacter silvermanii TaxID=321763 RepID=A0A1G9MHJ0_9FIRM|nr:flagellar hook-length control protein FliK [Halarsenatibacter silvermanii]SDL73738.1 hook-length control protein FliK [Halarsenatibacter silvermanii]
MSSGAVNILQGMFNASLDADAGDLDSEASSDSLSESPEDFSEVLSKIQDKNPEAADFEIGELEALLEEKEMISAGAGFAGPLDLLERLVQTNAIDIEISEGKLVFSSEELSDELVELLNESEMDLESLLEMKEASSGSFPALHGELMTAANFAEEEIDALLEETLFRFEDRWQNPEKIRSQIRRAMRSAALQGVDTSELVEMFGELEPGEAENMLFRMMLVEADAEEISGLAESDKNYIMHALLNSESTEESFSQLRVDQDLAPLLEKIAEHYDLSDDQVEKLIDRVRQKYADGENRSQLLSEMIARLDSEAADIELESRPARHAAELWNEVLSEVLSRELDYRSEEVDIKEFLRGLDDSESGRAEIDSELLRDLLFGEEDSRPTANWQELTAELLNFDSQEEVGEFDLELDLDLDPDREGLNPADLSDIPGTASDEQQLNALGDYELAQLMMSGGAETAAAEIESDWSGWQQSAVDQIVESFTLLQGQERDTMLLQLEPENLGKIGIEISVESGEVLAHLVVEDSAVRSELENNLGTLHRSLVREGFEVNQITLEGSDEENPLLSQEEGGQQREDDSGSSEREGSFEEEFSSEWPGRISRLDDFENGEIDEELRGWLRWKQYQYTWI